MFCYSNHGASMRAVEAGYLAGAGEVVFSDYASQAELEAAFPGYTPPLPPQELTIRRQALAALDKTDQVYLRCGKAGVSWPSEWQTYVVALRGLVSNPVGSLPTQPPFPSGT